MNDRFAAWVEPIAEGHRRVRAETLALANSLSPADLERETGDTGWTVRDEFMHIAASESNVVGILDAISRGEAVDMSFFNDLDANNARQLAEARGRAMQAVADELAAGGAEFQLMLSRLAAEDESRTPAGLPFPLGQLAAGYSQHEPYHLSQIRAALGRVEAAG